MVCLTINLKDLDGINIYYSNEDSQYVLQVGPGATNREALEALGRYYNNSGIATIASLTSTGTLSMGGCPNGAAFGALTLYYKSITM